MPNRKNGLSLRDGSDKTIGVFDPLNFLQRVLSPDGHTNLLSILATQIPNFNNAILTTSEQHILICWVPIKTFNTLKMSCELSYCLIGLSNIPNRHHSVLLRTSEQILIVWAKLNALYTLHLIIMRLQLLTAAHLNQVHLILRIINSYGLIVTT